MTNRYLGTGAASVQENPGNRVRVAVAEIASSYRLIHAHEPRELTHILTKGFVLHMFVS